MLFAARTTTLWLNLKIFLDWRDAHFSSNVCSDAHFFSIFFHRRRESLKICRWKTDTLHIFIPLMFPFKKGSIALDTRQSLHCFPISFKEMKEIAKRRFNSTWSTQAKCTWFSPYMTWANIDAGWFHVPRFLTRTAQLALDRTSIANIFAELWLLLR